MMERDIIAIAKPRCNNCRRVVKAALMIHTSTAAVCYLCHGRAQLLAASTEATPIAVNIIESDDISESDDDQHVDQDDDDKFFVTHSSLCVRVLDNIFRHAHVCADDKCAMVGCSDYKEHLRARTRPYERMLIDHEVICDGTCNISGCLMWRTRPHAK